MSTFQVRELDEPLPRDVVWHTMSTFWLRPSICPATPVASRTDLRVIVGIRHQISRLNGRKISDQLLNMTIVE